MNRAVQYLPSILGRIVLLASIATAANAQGASPVLVAKFAGNLSTKSAKVGDVVIAKTEKPAKIANGKEIPKGSQIIGKLVAVQAKQAGKSDSLLAIKFEQLDVNGEKLPIEGQIVAIGPAPAPGTPDTSYFGIGHSTPVFVVDPVASTTDQSDGKDELGVVGASSLPGVTLALHLNDAGATELNGYKRDIKLNSTVLIKVKLN